MRSTLLKLILIIVICAECGLLAWALSSKPAPVLASEDVQAVQNIVNDPEILQIRKDMQAAEEKMGLLKRLFDTRLALLQGRLEKKLNVELPEKYAMPGFTYDMQQATWVKKPTPAAAPEPTTPAKPGQ